MSVLALAPSGSVEFPLESASSYAQVTDPSDALVGLTLQSDGVMTTDTYGRWMRGGIGSHYDAYVTATGDVPTGTLGAAVNLATNKSWSLSQTTVGAKSTVLSVEIRLAGTATVVAGPVSVYLDAEVLTNEGGGGA